MLVHYLTSYSYLPIFGEFIRYSMYHNSNPLLLTLFRTGSRLRHLPLKSMARKSTMLQKFWIQKSIGDTNGVHSDIISDGPDTKEPMMNFLGLQLMNFTQTNWFQLSMLGNRTNLVPWNPFNPVLDNHAFSIIKNSFSFRFLTKNNNVLFYLQFYIHSESPIDSITPFSLIKHY